MATAAFHAKSTALEVVKGLEVHLGGKVAIITGGTSGKMCNEDRTDGNIRRHCLGIGVETARALAATKAHVIITARDMDKGAQVVEDIRKTTGNNDVEAMECNLTSLQSVRTFASQFRARQLPINILICTSRGVVVSDHERLLFS